MGLGMALLVWAGLVFAQPVRVDEIGKRAVPFERLQNDVASAIAHAAQLTAADRAKLDRVNLVLGQAIADRNAQRKIKKKKVLEALKDIGVVSSTAFTESDRKLIDQDCKRAEAAAKEPSQVRYIYTGKPGQPI